MDIKPMHLSNREPSQLRLATRCCARTRSGMLCQSPAVSGKSRCRMHGGAAGSGAPRGSQNGRYRHGLRTQAAMAEARRVREVIAEWREVSKLLPV